MTQPPFDPYGQPGAGQPGSWQPPSGPPSPPPQNPAQSPQPAPGQGGFSQPSYGGQPAYGQPPYGQPSSQPAYGQPGYGQPAGWNAPPPNRGSNQGKIIALILVALLVIGGGIFAIVKLTSDDKKPVATTTSASSTGAPTTPPPSTGGFPSETPTASSAEVPTPISGPVTKTALVEKLRAEPDFVPLETQYSALQVNDFLSCVSDFLITYGFSADLRQYVSGTRKLADVRGTKTEKESEEAGANCARTAFNIPSS